MSTDRAARTALILQRHAEEQEWAYNLRIRDGLHWHAIRAIALRPPNMGGIGRDPGIAGLKGMVAEYRAAQGEIVGNREERIERRQLEIDELALIARGTLSGDAFMPDLSALAPDDLDNEKTKIEKAKAVADIETRVRIAAARMRGDAAKLLLDVRAAEAKMHGDDAAQRVELDVTTHTQLDAEIDAALERMDALDASRQEG